MRRVVPPLAFLVPALAGCFPDPCGNEVMKLINSPSGKHSAVVFSRSCGATTGFSTQVSILPTGERLPNDGGNTFITNGKVDLALKWQDSSTLFIQSGGSQVFKRETAVSGITVKYGQNAL